MKTEKSLFVDFFGDYPMIRVLDFLIENDIFDYGKKEICRNAGVSWNTMETFWGQLEEKGAVKYTRQVGKAKMYKLNIANPVVKQLIELDRLLLRKSMDGIGQPKEKTKALA
ncbi:MAG: hypothetical protein HY394_03690 [Candidatus Diapherotrites archaeon]|nr:hypothetical protein [Candidatus Diapherotrites archaeon]